MKLTSKSKKVSSSDENFEKALRIKALCTVLVKLVNHDIEQRLKDNNLEINVSALIPLRILQFSSLTIQELSEKMLVAPATLIPIIDELEAKKLIIRAMTIKDRRKKELNITSKGVQLISEVMKLNSNNILVQAVNKLSTRRASDLVNSLDELVTNVAGNDSFSKIIAANAARNPIKSNLNQ